MTTGFTSSAIRLLVLTDERATPPLDLGSLEERGCGIGKSFLACAFVERACRRGFAAR